MGPRTQAMSEPGNRRVRARHTERRGPGPRPAARCGAGRSAGTTDALCRDMSSALLSFPNLASPPPASDVVELLSADHDEIAVLFATLAELSRDAARDDEARALVATLSSAIVLHAKAEERVVYAVCAEWG